MSARIALSVWLAVAASLNVACGGQVTGAPGTSNDGGAHSDAAGADGSPGMACPLPNGAGDCASGETCPSGDGCNSCVCNDGTLTCGAQPCGPPPPPTCHIPSNGCPPCGDVVCPPGAGVTDSCLCGNNGKIVPPIAQTCDFCCGKRCGLGEFLNSGCGCYKP